MARDDPVSVRLQRSAARAAWRGLAVWLLALGVAGAAGLGAHPAEAQSPPSAANPWRVFEGIWTAVGRRDDIPLGGDRRASVADLKGALSLTGAQRPAVGFEAEAIVLNDSATGAVGRAVWTDSHGDQVFSELRGQTTATGHRLQGTIIGGTGRYSGATGAFEFSWRFLLEGEDGAIQGQSVGLRGQVRFAPRVPGTPPR